MSENIQSVQLNLEEITPICEDVLRAGYPFLIRGRHGIGKSEYIKQVADSLGLDYIDKRISQMSPGDLLGLPDDLGMEDYLRSLLKHIVDEDTDLDLSDPDVAYKAAEMMPENLLREKNVTTFAPPEWYQRACEEPVVLFLDEINRGDIEVRQGVFELGDSRSLWGNELHPGTKIVSATNGGVCAADYSVHEMDHASLSRWQVYDVKADPKVWLEWAKDEERVIDFIWEFISDKPDRLMHGLREGNANWERGVVYPEPRSWYRLSDTLLTRLESEDTEEDYIDEIDHSHIHKLAIGYVGPDTAQELSSFHQDFDREMKVEDLLEGDWDESDFEDWTEPDFSNMVDKLDVFGVLKERVLEDHEREALRDFMEICPNENFVQLVQVLTTLRQDDTDFAEKQVVPLFNQKMDLSDVSFVDEDEMRIKEYLKKVVMDEDSGVDTDGTSDDDEEDE